MSQGRGAGELWGCPKRGKRCSLRAWCMCDMQGRRREIQTAAGKDTQDRAGEVKGPECNM